jgi:hypothetical protein
MHLSMEYLEHILKFRRLLFKRPVNRAHLGYNTADIFLNFLFNNADKTINEYEIHMFLLIT